MKNKEISSEMEDRRPQPQHAGGWAAPRWEMGDWGFEKSEKCEEALALALDLPLMENYDRSGGWREEK